MDDLKQKFINFRKWWQSKLKIAHDWNREHAMQRKLFISGSIVAVMIALLAGTRLVPEKSKFADTPIGQEMPFGSNSDLNIALTSRKYNEKKRFMVINLSVSSQYGKAINPKNIKISAVTLVAQQAKYHVIPLANNQFVLVIDGLNPGYKAIQVRAKNLQGSTSGTAQGVDSSESTASSSSSSDESGETKDGVNFVINEDKRFIHNKLPRLTQKDYAIRSLQSSINKLEKKEKANDKLIEAYQKQIATDKAAIKNQETDSRYKVDQNATKQAIDDANTDIQQQMGNIKDARAKNRELESQIELYRTQINDIEMGNYKFDMGTTTGQMN